MAGVICLSVINTRNLHDVMRIYLPAQNGRNQHPAQVTFVIWRVQVLRHDIAAGRRNTVVGPFGNGGRSG